MPNWNISVNTFVFCFIQVISRQNIYLTPAQANADVNKRFTFTCTFYGFAEVVGTKWLIGNKASPSTLRYPNGTCSGRGILSNDTIYKVECPSETSFSVTILHVQIGDHRETWQCSYFEWESNTVTMFVNVPVAYVILSVSETGSTFIREHSRQTISCKTSVARPQPNVRWYLQETTISETHKIAVNSTTRVISSDKDGFVSVESTLLLYPNRSINSWMLFCEGWTDNENHAVKSNKLKMNITYPPKSPPKIVGFEDGEKYTLKELNVGTLSCSVYGGNPLPRLTWNCYNSTQTPDVIDGETVTRNITWIGSREQTSCSCISSHLLSGVTQSTIISVDIIFPTEIKTFSFSSKRSEDTVLTNETDEVYLVCIAEANPSSNLSIENPSGVYISEVSNSNIVDHTLRNVSCVNAGEYTCTGKNIYTRGLPARSPLILIVKCPPKPSSGDTSVENVATSLGIDKTLTFSALKYLDEPKKTVFKWFKGNQYISDYDIKYIIRSEELQTNLSIRNTTKQDLGLYRVSVRNSVGEYVHYYELNEAAVGDRPTETVCSTTTGAYLGVGAGSSLFTLVIVVCLFIGHKRFMKLKCVRRKCQKQDVMEKQKVPDTEESQVSSAYTNLDESKKEVNEYDAINVQSISSQQQDMQTQGPCEYVEMKDASDSTKEAIDYININI